MLLLEERIIRFKEWWWMWWRVIICYGKNKVDEALEVVDCEGGELRGQFVHC